MQSDSAIGQLADSEWAAFIVKLEAAEHEFALGRPAAFKALWSQGDEVSICGAFGGVQSGWEKVAARLDWASSQFSEGIRSREEISSVVRADFAYIVQTELIRFGASGRTERGTLELRVTMVFRREADGWRIVHRHADSQTSTQAAAGHLRARPVSPARSSIDPSCGRWATRESPVRPRSQVFVPAPGDCAERRNAFARLGSWKFALRSCFLAALCLLVHPFSTFAEVTRVTVTSKGVVADGQAFGSTGLYEKLVGRIEFALDPTDPHNTGIVDLEHAPRGTDGRVRFSSDLYVLRPSNPAKGNGVLLFEVANRGRMGLLGRFNRGGGGNDPTTAADFGDGLLMRDGYTLVWIGWEINVPAPLLRIDAPPAILPSGSIVDPLSVELMVNERTTAAFLIDDPAGRPPVIYPPAGVLSPTDLLTVRDHFWDAGIVIPRERWRFVAGPNGLPKIQLDGGFEPGRFYRVTYHAAAPLVAGVGLAAIRDAAAAFRYRSDLPIHGQASYAFGASQSGRFLRQFLYDGFNIDERDRRVFDAMWVHIAGAARGSFSFNERFATPTHGAMFTPTRFPFSDLEQSDINGTRAGLQSRYRLDQRPKVFYTNTPVEYWGGGRAAALTHTTIDGKRDLTLPENARIYFLAGTQHIVPAFPPTRTPPVSGAGESAAARSGGQQLNNPTPQANVMRALLRALHQWTADGTPPPASKYPRLSDKTLVSIQDNKFPSLAGVSDPRRIVGPARIIGGKVTPLPHLVPQVDRDGNDLTGIRDPEVAVPLATTTGWNFRAEAVGNPSEIYQLLGSYIPFAKTRAGREAGGDSRLSIEERYRGLDDYLQRIRSAAMDLIRDRYLLQEDLDDVLTRASNHWTFATRGQSSAAADRR